MLFRTVNGKVFKNRCGIMFCLSAGNTEKLVFIYMKILQIITKSCFSAHEQKSLESTVKLLYSLFNPICNCPHIL